MSLHAFEPVQWVVQVPLEHVMLSHAFEPEHVTSQFLVMHEMPMHESVARQSTSQLAALPQLIAPHAPAWPHVMLHLRPSGHAMAPLPVPVMLHSIGVFDSSQLPHTEGHTNTKESIGRASGVPRMQ